MLLHIIYVLIINKLVEACLYIMGYIQSDFIILLLLYHQKKNKEEKEIPMYELISFILL